MKQRLQLGEPAAQSRAAAVPVRRAQAAVEPERQLKRAALKQWEAAAVPRQRALAEPPAL